MLGLAGAGAGGLHPGRRNRRSCRRARCWPPTSRGASHPRGADPRARPRLRRRGRHRRARDRQRLDDELERRPLFPAAERQQILGRADRVRRSRRRQSAPRPARSPSAARISPCSTSRSPPRSAPNGYTTTLDNLMFRALTQSDNTCNDAVLRTAGGPNAVRAMLTRNRIEGIRFGPGERLMQSQIAGLQWSPAYSVGRAFYQARNGVPDERRRVRVRGLYRGSDRRRDARRAGRRPRPGCGAANCCRAPRPSGCSRSCRRPGPGRSG